MADQYIQVPTDSSGKKVRTVEKTVGANTVQVHFWIKDGLAMAVDDGGSGIIYVGEAAPGTLTSSASWRIKKIDQTTNPTIITWADGIDAFTKIWDNRGTLTYS